MPISDLQPQCHTDNIKDWTLGADETGRPTVWLAMDGAPGHPSWLVAVSPTDGEIRRRLPIVGMTGPKAVIQTGDGTIYVGGYHRGALFRHRPGSDQVEDLGLPFRDTEFIFALLPGPDGAVYGGTWPAGAAFRWSTQDGFTPIGSSPIQPGHQWLRCLARDDRTDTLLLGSGTPAGWTLYDPRSNTQRSIVLPEVGEQAFGYTATARSGTAVLVDIDTAWVVRLHRSASSVQVDPWYRIDEVSPVRPAIIDPVAGTVVVWRSGRLIRCTPDDEQTLTPTPYAAAGLGYQPANCELSWPTKHGINVLRLPEPEAGTAGAVRETPIRGRLPQSPQATSALAIGPDRRVYSGGFLNGGLGVHDPIAGTHTELGPISQPEVIACWADDLLVGSYPGAHLQLIPATDLTPERFAITDTLSFHADGQDRPYAFAALDDHTGYAGFMADYGRLDGGLVRLQRVPDAAPGQRLSAGPVVLPTGPRSVIGLQTVHRSDGRRTIFGSTMVDGGMGIAPTRSQAVLFELDPDTEAITCWTPPIPCRTLYGPVALAGRIWLIAEDRLVSFTPETEEWQQLPGWPATGPWADTETIPSPAELAEPPEAPEDRRFHAHQAVLRAGPNGTLLCSLAGVGVIETDLTARTTRTLWSGQARHLTVADDGAVYFVDATSLSLVRLDRLYDRV